MKLIINTSTLSATGVTQVAVSFIEECKKHNTNEYHVFLSKRLEKEISQNQYPTNFHFYQFEKHPKLYFSGMITRNRQKMLEKRIKPDCVFSVFGPSYWTPDSPHLMGYAYPHYVYKDSPFFLNLSFRKKLKIKLYEMIHRYLFRRNGFYYVAETEDVSNRLAKYLRINRSNIFTVSNTYNHFFKNFLPKKNILPKKSINQFRFLSLCSFSDHKNLLILNHVIPLLKTKNLKKEVKFILTIDNEIFFKSFTDEAKSYIINLGRLPVADCPQVYYESDALFLPTLLECFTANYPEAMIMQKPIVTSNLPFATSVCDHAAIYFDPLKPEDIVDKIALLVNDINLNQNLVKRGNERLLNFETAEKRALSYLNICQQIIVKEGL